MLENFKPKLIAFDIDGTVLNDEGELTPRTEAALKSAIAAGIKVISATGRMYPSARPILRQIGITSPCVVYNGAQVRDPVSEDIVFELALDSELTSDVLSFFHKNNWYAQIYHEDKLLVEDDGDERCRYYEMVSRIKAVPLGKRFWDFNGPSVKMLGIAFESDVYQDMVKRTVEEFGDRLYTAESQDAFIEMVHHDVNKARSLARVAKVLDIEQKDILAFGNGANDREMLAWAGVGVAMDNAPSRVKDCADMTAPDNDSDGVAVIIEKLLRSGI